MFFERWRWHRAARLYGEQLGPDLMRNYGGGPTYTVGQIDAAIARAGLKPGFAALGYAAFLTPNDYESLRAVRTGLLDLQVCRVLLSRYGPWSLAASDGFEDPRGIAGILRGPWVG